MMSGDHNQSRFNEALSEAMSADDYQVGGVHYKQMQVQPWELMESILTHEEFIGFLKGNCIKYAMRQGTKVNSDDGAKLKHYLRKLSEVYADY